MRKLFCLAIVFALLLTGCGARPALEETTAETTGSIIETETQPQPPTTQPGPTEEEWAEITPPLDYEIMYGFAKTPTHYYAAHDSGIVRAPIGDIARQEKVPLPEKHEGMKLAGAEICGVTKDYLFVNMWEARKKIRDTYGDGADDYYEYEDYENRMCVTYRIKMGSWEAEFLAVGKYGGAYPLPWYNSVSDSLLIPRYNDGSPTVEAMPMDTRKRISVESCGGWWCNTLDGRAVKRGFTFGDEDDIDVCYVYDAENQAQLTRIRDLNLPKYWDWRKREAPKNKAEEAILATYGNEESGPTDYYISTYASCGNYTYFVGYSYETQQSNLYRRNTDGTGRKLLRENTNIDYLVSAGGKLFCRAYHPTVRNEWGAGQLDMYLLNEDGKVEEVLFSYGEDTEGNSGYSIFPYDDKIIIEYHVIYSRPGFLFLYDPATGARFPAQEG